jgi:hypothetical protein
VVNIRVLVALEDEYRAYREVIAAGIQILRPNVEVTTATLEELEAEVARLDPQVVISSHDKPASVRAEVSWAKEPIDSVPRSNTTLEALLAVIDEHAGSKSAGGSGAGGLGTKLSH